jgi:hypothetical protein
MPNKSSIIAAMMLLKKSIDDFKNKELISLNYNNVVTLLNDELIDDIEINEKSEDKQTISSLRHAHPSRLDAILHDITTGTGTVEAVLPGSYDSVTGLKYQAGSFRLKEYCIFIARARFHLLEYIREPRNEHDNTLLSIMYDYPINSVDDLAYVVLATQAVLKSNTLLILNATPLVLLLADTRLTVDSDLCRTLIEESEARKDPWLTAYYKSFFEMPVMYMTVDDFKSRSFLHSTQLRYASSKLYKVSPDYRRFALFDILSTILFPNMSMGETAHDILVNISPGNYRECYTLFQLDIIKWDDDHLIALFDWLNSADAMIILHRNARTLLLAGIENDLSRRNIKAVTIPTDDADNIGVDTVNTEASCVAFDEMVDSVYSVHLEVDKLVSEIKHMVLQYDLGVVFFKTQPIQLILTCLVSELKGVSSADIHRGIMATAEKAIG